MRDDRGARLRRQSWFGAKRHAKIVLSLPVIHSLMRAVAPRVPGVRVGRLPAPGHLSEVVGRAGSASFVMMQPARCEIAKELYWGRGRRPEAADAFALELMITLTGEARHFFDIGAYTGLFAVAVSTSNPQVRTRAFEMVPAVAAALERNVQRNGLTERVQLHVAGVGDPGTTARVPDRDAGSALPSFISADMSFRNGVEVGFVALDEFTGTVEGPVVMKIDVEGGEEEVFSHGQGFLAAHRPDILCEVLPAADGHELEALLSPHGYLFYAVGGDSLHPRQHLRPCGEYRDWLLTCRPPAELRASGAPVAAPRGR